MFVKSRALAVAVAAAGVIGFFGAPMASAATVAYGPGDNGGLVNLSHNQVPIQGCSNDVGVGVLGAGVPVDGAAVAAALLGATGNTSSSTDRSCHLANGQDNDAIQTFGAGGSGSSCSAGCSSNNWGMSATSVDPSSDNGGLVNVSHNQVPVQVCNNDVSVGVLGAGVDADTVTGALGILGVTGNTSSTSDRSCHLENGQAG
ncbi:MAG: hypothetical protein ACRDN0_25670 [Trebonia sp.]